jgi:acyl-CoA hydrolase
MKPIEAKDWPRLIRPGSRVFIGGGASVPFALVDLFLAAASGFKDLELVHIHGLGETPWIDPKYEGILRTNSFFLTPSLRDAVERGQADYTPCPMSEVASLFEDGPLPLDVALIQVSPPDADGWCSYGVSVDVVKSAAESARLVIAQINPEIPRRDGRLQHQHNIPLALILRLGIDAAGVSQHRRKAAHIGKPHPDGGIGAERRGKQRNTIHR